MTVAGLLLCGVVLLVTVVALATTRPRGATPLDFYLAGQRVGVVTNACAICGDYVSAASFLGVAAAVYASGIDGVWYATGFAAGFVPVLLFIAAPLRRFGRFSLPDFLGRRLGSERVRLVAVVVVQLVVLAYLVPQGVAGGLTWELLAGAGIAGLSPYATGVLLSAVVVTTLVVVGGMRGTTWTQALQFVVLLAALVWLAVAVTVDGFSYPAAVERLSQAPLRNPVLVDGVWNLQPVRSALTGAEAPSFTDPGARYGPVGQFALVLTLALGTAGLPHIVNRYFTAPSGAAARVTTVWVLGLVGAFYVLAVLLGVAARDVLPAAAASQVWLEPLTVEGVLRVPEYALLALGRLVGGEVGLGVVATGAAVAVLSTIAGLLLASAASLGHDVYERHMNPRATARQAVRAGRVAVAVVALASVPPALLLEPRSLTALFPSVIAAMVSWAFALAGSALTPVMVLSIWWRGTTAAGAVTGMVVGTVTAVGAVAVGLAAGAPGTEALLTPTLVAAPAAAVATVAVSRRTAVPADLDALWVRMHGTAADRRAERLAALTIRGVDREPAPASLGPVRPPRGPV